MYVKMGMIIKKVHKVMAFKQTHFIKTYIEWCTQKRKEARSHFGKQIFKNFLNSLYGKFVQQQRNFIDMHVTNNPERAQKLISSPRFENMKIINSNLIAVFLKQSTVHLNKPIIVGASILEASKRVMYDLYYNVLQKYFGKDSISVVFSDTDSFLCRMRTNNLTRDLKNLEHVFDFSNYPVSHVLYDDTKKSLPGLLKDEMEAKYEISSFIGLRSKCYCLKLKSLETLQTSTKAKCKGISKSAQRQLRYEAYKKCIKSIHKVNVKMTTIQSKNHVLRTTHILKTGLSSFDDKKFIYDCGLHTSPYGSCLIKIKRGIAKCPFCQRK
jgi:hypothetical protein